MVFNLLLFAFAFAFAFARRRFCFLLLRLLPEQKGNLLFQVINRLLLSKQHVKLLLLHSSLLFKFLVVSSGVLAMYEKAFVYIEEFDD